MNRRSFFKFLPVAPMALMAEGARAVNATGEPIPEATQIILQGNKRKEFKSNSLSIGGGTLSMNESDPSKQVSMAVGDDGNLWLKQKDGGWRRVAVE